MANTPPDLHVVDGNVNITIGQSWCGWSKKQEAANEGKDDVVTVMCDTDKENPFCQSLAPQAQGFPTNFACEVKDGELDLESCSAKPGFDANFGGGAGGGQ